MTLLWPGSPATYLDAAFSDQPDCLWVEQVFLLQNPCRKGLFRIPIHDGDRRLEYDGSCVHPFIHKVDSAARNLDAVFNGLLLGMEARKRGQ